MSRGIRIIVSALAAAGVTFGLFLLMYHLIASDGADQRDYEDLSGINFGPVDVPEEVTRRDRKKPPPPPPPKEPPPPPKLEVSDPNPVQQNLPNLDMPQLDLAMSSGSGIYLGNFSQVDRNEEGDIIPLVRIEPQYPREAALNKIEGEVLVEFTITEVGTVKDPRVVSADPPRIFNREALRAILKWKFKPRVVDGVATERRATQVITFRLAN